MYENGNNGACDNGKNDVYRDHTFLDFDHTNKWICRGRACLIGDYTDNGI